MKLAVFIVALLAVSVSCQTQNTIEACMNDLKADTSFVKDLATAVQTKNILQIVVQITMAQPMIDKTNTDCRNMKKADILNFSTTLFNGKEKECLVTVLATVNAATALKKDNDQKNYIQVIQDLAMLTTAITDTKAKCNGVFGLVF